MDPQDLILHEPDLGLFDESSFNTYDSMAWLDTIAELQNTSGASTRPQSLSEPLSVTQSESSGQSAGQSSCQSHTPASSNQPSTPSDDEGHSCSSSESSSPGRVRKAKKSRIALDPSQPPTIRGKSRARVYVACHQCRNRKIRCDGAKPVCYNCHRRDHGTERCEYDSAPRRRGQDKVPGARIRPRPDKDPQRDSQVASGYPIDADRGDPNPHMRHVKPLPVDFEGILHGFNPATFDPDAIESYELPPPPIIVTNTTQHDNDKGEEFDHLIAQPNMKFARETWWDAVLMLYASEDTGWDVRSVVLGANNRPALTQRIFTDLRATLRASLHWASFLHLPRFFESLLLPARRSAVQPSLLLSMLAYGAFVQGSELNDGGRTRKKALKLIDHAYSALQGSLNSNWVDPGLVQAAWFIVYFEMQGHPEHKQSRLWSSILLLDSLIRLLALTTLDADRPDSQYAIFGTYVSNMAQFSLTASPNAMHVMNCMNTAPGLLGNTKSTCDCDQYTLKRQWPAVSEIAPSWESTTLWPQASSEGEFKKEECRRLVWSSVMLTAAYNSCIAADTQVDTGDLFIKDYENYALFFPGEAMLHAGFPPARLNNNNVWNLCFRAMILWHTSVRNRSRNHLNYEERAQFAMNAWLEADAIEAALNQHTCDVENDSLFQAWEYLFSIRMCVSYEFKLFAPEVTSNGIMYFYREKAELWLHKQMRISDRIYENLQEPDGEMKKRPLLVYWFIGHIVRALVLLKSDPTLLIALDAAKTFIKPIEYLMRIWPCPDQRESYQPLRYELTNACLRAGVEPPSVTLPVSHPAS